MEGDAVVALGRATVDGSTLFGQNSHRPAREGQALHRTPAREHATGEMVRVQYLELPQARHTHAVLGSRPDGWWGYTHGVNEHGLAAGCCALQGRLGGPGPALTGGDLVRLALERCRSGRQAVALLMELIERHGQAPAPGVFVSPAGDNALLVADAAEAFALEAAGRHWVYQQVREVRAISNVHVVRQDWDRIASGLAEIAIGRDWWPGDGSKLDFAGTLAAHPTGQASGLRRWGRATYLHEEQNGHIDAGFVRRLLGDHYEGTHFEVNPFEPAPGPVAVCRHAGGLDAFVTAASWVAHLGGPDRLPVVWSAVGQPCLGVYVPLFLDGELPPGLAAGGRAAFGRELQRLAEPLAPDSGLRDRARERCGRLQAQFDAAAEAFAVRGAKLKQRGMHTDLHQQAGALMQEDLEQLRAAVADLGLALAGGLAPQRPWAEARA